MPTAHANDNLGYAMSGRSADIRIMGLNGTHLHFTINTGMTHNTDSCSCSSALNIHRIGSVRERELGVSHVWQQMLQDLGSISGSSVNGRLKATLSWYEAKLRRAICIEHG